MPLFRTYLIALTLATALVLPFPTGTWAVSAAAGPPRATVPGYSRAEFGEGWATLGDGCTTRSTAMALAFAAGSCHVPHRQWDVSPVTDPYTGDPLAPGDVEIDHLVPLAAAWDLGAHTWDPARRRAFANDPRNLVVTSSRANQAKSDQLPSQWMPRNWRARCAYGRQLAGVAAEYGLALPRADLRAARRACGGVQGLFGRTQLAVFRPVKSGRGPRVP